MTHRLVNKHFVRVIEVYKKTQMTFQLVWCIYSLFDELYSPGWNLITVPSITMQSTLCVLHRTNSFYKDFFFFRPQSHISRDMSVTPSNLWSVGKVCSLMLTSISLWPPLVFIQDADLPKNTWSKQSAKIKTAANASRCTAYFSANNFT